MRIRVAKGDISIDGTLRSDTLMDVCDTVRREHQRAMMRRRYFLRQGLAKALLYAGAGPPSYSADGLVRVASTTTPRREYGIWLAPRPPELDDFHAAHAGRQAP